MRAARPIFGITTLIIVHLTWLFIPMLYGFEWMKLSPALLVLACFIIGFYHKDVDLGFLSYAAIVYSAGFILSAVGANTGSIFGSFFYGKNLGILLFDTPIAVGILWLLLSYSTSVTASYFTQRSPVLNKPVITVALASILMLLVDFLLEKVASGLDFWYWKNQQVPVQNYTAWFVFAVAFNFLFQQLEIDASNKMARWFLALFMLLLICLAVFPAAS